MYDVDYTLLTQAKCTVKIWAAGNGSRPKLKVIYLSSFLPRFSISVHSEILPRKLKLMFSEKALKIDEIFTIDLRLCKGQ